MRKPLSMKRLHLLSASYCIFLGEEIGTEELKHQLAFLKYVWEHKDDDLQITDMLYKKVQTEMKSPQGIK